MTLPRWQDENIVGERREPMHVPLRAFESAAQAHSAQVLQSAPVESKWILPLTPASWAFHLAPDPHAAPTIQPGDGFDASEWGSIDVPLSMEAADVGAQAQYTNVRYPFPLEPPKIPNEDNHVGSYQTSFTLPDAWRGRPHAPDEVPRRAEAARLAPRVPYAAGHGRHLRDDDAHCGPCLLWPCLPTMATPTMGTPTMGIT